MQMLQALHYQVQQVQLNDDSDVNTDFDVDIGVSKLLTMEWF